MSDSPAALAPVEVEAAPTAPAEAERAADSDAVCWCCGGPTLKRHCKIVCLNCGFTRDCSDP